MDVIQTDSSLLLYQTEDGQTKIEVRLQDETVWLSQAQLCELKTSEQSLNTYRTFSRRENSLKNQLSENSGQLLPTAKTIK